MYRHRVSLTCFFSHCYTCIKTWAEFGILCSTILEKTKCAAGIWKICCCIHILAWISHNCVVIHKLLVLDGSLHYVQCVPYAAILQICILFSMIWYCRIQLPAVSKQRDVPWCGFRRSIPLSIDYVWNTSIDRLSRLLHADIAYEIDNAKIIAAFLPTFLLFLHDLIRLNSILRHVQPTKFTMMWFSMIDSDINLLCLKCV